MKFILLAALACLALSEPAMAQDTDLTKVDNDSNGLSEIYTLEDLNNGVGIDNGFGLYVFACARVG